MAELVVAFVTVSIGMLAFFLALRVLFDLVDDFFGVTPRCVEPLRPDEAPRRDTFEPRIAPLGEPLTMVAGCALAAHSIEHERENAKLAKPCVGDDVIYKAVAKEPDAPEGFLTLGHYIEKDYAAKIVELQPCIPGKQTCTLMLFTTEGTPVVKDIDRGSGLYEWRFPFE